MKKTLKTITVVAAYMGIGLMTNCKKSAVLSPLNCGNDAEKVTDAAIAYSNDPTKARCEAYKNSVRDFYKSCATFYTGASKKALDDFMAEPCPN